VESGGCVLGGGGGGGGGGGVGSGGGGRGGGGGGRDYLPSIDCLGWELFNMDWTHTADPCEKSEKGSELNTKGMISFRSSTKARKFPTSSKPFKSPPQRGFIR